MAKTVDWGASPLHKILLAVISRVVVAAVQMPVEAQRNRAGLMLSGGSRRVVGFVGAVPDGL